MEKDYMNPMEWDREQWKGAAEAMVGGAAAFAVCLAGLWVAAILGGAA